MALPVAGLASGTPDEPAGYAAASRAVPGRLAGRILLFEFAVLAEYWLSPLLLGITNYAGLWSTVGVGLFFLFVGSVVGLVLWPLRAHLAGALTRARDRWSFHAVWVAALLLALVVTNTFQFGVPATATGYSAGFGMSTVYTPFGAWPSLTLYVPAAHFFGTFDPELLTIVALLSVLGSAAVRLSAARRARECPVPATAPVVRPPLRRLAALAVWSPLGFITGCASCAPLYLSALGLVAPSLAAGGLSAVPLVPWIGFAGLLYLVSFGLAFLLLRKATAPAVPDPSVEG